MLFRLFSVLVIAGLIHRQAERSREDGRRPIRISEVKTFLPEAARFKLRSSPNRGLAVYNSEDQRIGFACRTMPHSREILGYSGPSDILLVFDKAEELKGILVRHSYDTPSHIEDVVKDYSFMEQWNGKSRSQIAVTRGLPMTKFHIVSGASRSSEAIVKSVVLRAGLGDANQEIDAKGMILPRFGWRDGALIACSLLALALAFSKKSIVQRNRLWIHLVMVIYIGIVAADLLAQSLLISWVQHGVPWKELIGLVVLAGTALGVPWATGNPVYCTHVCPHGILQRWVMKILPARHKRHLHSDDRWSFSILPGLLLVTVLIIAFCNLPIDLAGLEPFDAWSLKGVGIATVAIAVVGLAVSIFVPMAYCRYGCPTGFLLDLLKRERGGFVKRDGWLLLLVILSVAFFSLS